jgi:hypothetical protein
MDAADRQMLETAVNDAVADAVASDGDAAVLDKVLTDLGWLEMLDVEPRDATEIVFTALGASNAAASALDDVVVDALGTDARADLAVVLPPFASWQAPGRRDGGPVRAGGIATSRIATATDVLVVGTSDSDVWSATVARAAVDATPVRGIDPDAGLHAVHIEHTAAVTALDADAWQRAVIAGQRAVAHQISGASRSILALAREHALEREQFDRPISKFQAVRHKLAETLVAIEALDAAVGAAWDEPSPMTAALAKAQAGRTARIVAKHCQQVLGGIGFTTDHAFHRFLKRTMALEGLFGSADELVLDLGRQLIAARAVPNLVEL